KTESSVSIVRNFFRLRLLQTRAKNFMQRWSEDVLGCWIVGLVDWGDAAGSSIHPSNNPSIQLSFDRFAAELAFVEMKGARSTGGGVGIVCDHDNRLAVLPIESLQQIENFIPGFSIQISGRLVAEQQG